MPRGSLEAQSAAVSSSLAIDGVVWGTRDRVVRRATAAVSSAFTTWAGALPFEAVRGDPAAQIATSIAFIRDAAAAIASTISIKLTTRHAARAARHLRARRRDASITGTDAPPIENATIVIRDGRIAAVGPAASTPVPNGVPSVDAKGMTIVPGLWDMHAHAGQTDWAPVYLASGVTTIRDMGGEEAFLVAIRDAIDSGKALGPRYLLAGLVDGGRARTRSARSSRTRRTRRRSHAPLSRRAFPGDEALLRREGRRRQGDHRRSASARHDGDGPRADGHARQRPWRKRHGGRRGRASTASRTWRSTASRDRTRRKRRSRSSRRITP